MSRWRAVEPAIATNEVKDATGLVLGLALVVWLAVRLPAQAFETAAKAAIMLDSRTGVVLFEKDADERLPPASRASS